MRPSDDGATRTILCCQVRIPLPEARCLETAEYSAQWQTKCQMSGLVLRTSVMSSLSLVGFPHNSCPYCAIYFPPPLFQSIPASVPDWQIVTKEHSSRSSRGELNTPNYRASTLDRPAWGPSTSAGNPETTPDIYIEGVFGEIVSGFSRFFAVSSEGLSVLDGEPHL